MTDEERRAKLIVPAGKIRLVIDTDAKNEVDDQFAIAWALTSPERFDVEAVYAAPFSTAFSDRDDEPEELREKAGKLVGSADTPADGMRQSYDEIVRIYDLLGLDPAGKVFYGSERYMLSDGPVDSPAARDLIGRAKASDETLYVAALGAITNVASALAMAPEIAEKIVVIWLGGQPQWAQSAKEFNLMQDVPAVRVVIESGVPLLMIPCMNVASLLTTAEDELRAKLGGRNALCDFLLSNVFPAFTDPEAAFAHLKLDRKGYLIGRNDYEDAYLDLFKTEHISWSRIIWDISTIAFLKNPNWVTSKECPAPHLTDEMQWVPASPEEARHTVRIANYCLRDFIFGDLFYCLTEKVH